MGVRVISSARNFSPAVPTYKGPLGVWQGSPHGRLVERRHSTPRMTMLFDGTTGKEGLAQALPANEAWMDPMSLVKFGLTQYSMTANYVGAGTCAVFGAMLPADYSVKVEDPNIGDNLVAEAAAQWQAVTTLNPNVAFNLFDITKVIVFTLYRFQFLASNVPGSVVVATL